MSKDPIKRRRQLEALKRSNPSLDVNATMDRHRRAQSDPAHGMSYDPIDQRLEALENENADLRQRIEALEASGADAIEMVDYADVEDGNNTDPRGPRDADDHHQEDDYDGPNEGSADVRRGPLGEFWQGFLS